MRVYVLKSLLMMLVGGFSEEVGFYDKLIIIIIIFLNAF